MATLAGAPTPEFAPGGALGWVGRASICSGHATGTGPRWRPSRHTHRMTAPALPHVANFHVAASDTRCCPYQRSVANTQTAGDVSVCVCIVCVCGCNGL